MICNGLVSLFTKLDFENCCIKASIPNLKNKELFNWFAENQEKLIRKEKTCIARLNYFATAIHGKLSLPTRLFIKEIEKTKELIKNGSEIKDHSIKRITQKLLNGEIVYCLNLGSGTGRDIKLLNEYFETTHYDPHSEFSYECINDFSLLKNEYDVVICNYILNVIVKYDRDIMIEILRHYIKKGSIIVIGVRQDKSAIKDNWIQFKDNNGKVDGYITSKPTFQHFYNRIEINIPCHHFILRVNLTR